MCVMPAWSFCSTHGQTRSSVACHNHTWAANTVGKRRALHAIIALGQQTRSGDIVRGMPSSRLESIHSWMTSCVACYHLPWAAHAIGRNCKLHARMDLGQHTRSDEIAHGVPSSPLDITHCRTTPGVICHHRPWAAHTFRRCRASHAIISFGQL